MLTKNVISTNLWGNCCVEKTTCYWNFSFHENAFFSGDHLHFFIFQTKKKKSSIIRFVRGNTTHVKRKNSVNDVRGKLRKFEGVMQGKSCHKDFEFQTDQ